MSEIKFSLWNIAWMNNLFKSDDGGSIEFQPDNHVPHLGYRGATVKQRREDISGVIHDISPDVLVITEGPNQDSELQHFFDTDVNGDWKCFVQQSGAQSIGIAINTAKFNPAQVTQYDSSHTDAGPLKFATDPFLEDTDADGVKEQHKFERKPLYIELMNDNGDKFRVVGLHLKSKGIFNSLEWSAWWARADGNRRKILAQCNRIRQSFIKPYLSSDDTKSIPLVVCGDINDGPGMDTSEMKLQSSGVERLMGVIWDANNVMGNVLYDSLSEKDQSNLKFSDIYTASFKDPIFNNYRKSWIDHVLYTRNETNWIKNGVVHHEMSDGQKIYKKFPNGSDHVPVSCIIDL